MVSETDLLKYVCNFIFTIRPEFSKPEEVDADHALEVFGLDSMDLIELQVFIMDDYGIDIFKYMDNRIMSKSLREIVELIISDEPL